MFHMASNNIKNKNKIRFHDSICKTDALNWNMQQG